MKDNFVVTVKPPIGVLQQHMAKLCYHGIYQISYIWYLQLKLALSATVSTHF